jgi:hypothetical protein
MNIYLSVKLIVELSAFMVRLTKQIVDKALKCVNILMNSTHDF